MIYFVKVSQNGKFRLKTLEGIKRQIIYLTKHSHFCSTISYFNSFSCGLIYMTKNNRFIYILRILSLYIGEKFYEVIYSCCFT